MSTTTKTANEIARVRAHYLGLAAKYRRADGSLPADIRDGLHFVAAQERKLAMENPGL